MKEIEEMARELAERETAWWQAHHRRNKQALIKSMAKLYELLYKIPLQEALECVKYRVLAAHEHDIAEEFEDKGNQKEANIHWEKVKELLEQHFEVLLKVKR